MFLKRLPPFMRLPDMVFMLHFPLMEKYIHMEGKASFLHQKNSYGASDISVPLLQSGLIMSIYPLWWRYSEG